jgi:threonine/homoserine/homoserine lactone efflux protein
MILMSFAALCALAGAMFILAATPGPGVFATVSCSLASGFKHAALVVLGIVLGDLIFLFLAIYGLSAIAESLHWLFILIKYAGAGYLSYLGIRLWLRKPEKMEIKGLKELSWKSSFFSGLFITLGNPKVILFYLGFLPTFIDLASLSLNDVIMIGLVVSIILGSTMLAYAFATSKARSFFHDEKYQQWINRSAGSVMVATGAVLATKS